MSKARKRTVTNPKQGAWDINQIGIALATSIM
jgi:hypothetical protein